MADDNFELPTKSTRKPRLAAGRVAPPARTIKAHVQNEKLVADRRERFIRAAITVFHRQGFHSATTADITREAGLTQSNLYNYVRSKQDVLFLVFEHLISMYNDVVSEVSAQYDDPQQRLIECLSALIHIMSQYRQEVFLLYSEINALEEPDRSTFAVMSGQFIQRFEGLLLDYEKASGRILMKDRHFAANLMTFTPAVLSLRSWDLDNYPNASREDAILDFILRGLGIPGRPSGANS